MSNAALGYTNYVKTGTVAASNAASLFPVTNIQGNSGAAADGWQTTVTSGIILTITPPLTQVSWHALGLFRTNLTSAATVTFALYTNPSTLMWTANTFGPVGGSGQVVAWTGGITADYALIAINDPGNPDGHINVPLAFGGPAWVPLSPLSLSTVYGRDKTTDEVVSRGGQEYPVLRYQRRRWNLNTQGVRTASELWPQLERDDAPGQPGQQRAGHPRHWVGQHWV